MLHLDIFNQGTDVLNTLMNISAFTSQVIAYHYNTFIETLDNNLDISILGAKSYHKIGN